MKDDQGSEWLHSKHSYAPGDIFGKPKTKTRIGDLYQAKIPTFMADSERSQCIELPTSQDAKNDVQNHSNFGLSNPVVWIQDQACKHEPAKGESWSVTEQCCFLLGLYIFGKNLGLVNKFMGNKGMKDVLSYYYGKFYRTGEHQNWSKYRKKSSKKSVPGKKIFAGWRQQEFFSRIFPSVTDECKTSLTEACYMFEDGKLSFEKYVFNIRDLVGIELLLEAVAIGKGKQDLTGKAEMPKKDKKLHPLCSSLKTEEIVNLLKDRIGLSNARLSELFWEAVWPRLLKRGWHSEQPGNFAFQNSKNSFVFLLPGINKFSRRSLKKGSHYFESFTDVLNKVALEPELLEPDPHPDQLVNPHAEQGEDEEQDSVEFIIVEPHLVGLERVVKMSELGITAHSEPSSGVSEETIQYTPEESQIKNANKNSFQCNKPDVTEGILGAVDSPDCEISSGVNKNMVNPGDPMVSRIENKETDPSTNEQPKLRLKVILLPQGKRRHHMESPTETSELQKYNSKLDVNSSDEFKAVVKKKRQRIAIDLNNPPASPDSNTNQLELPSPMDMDAGAS